MNSYQSARGMKRYRIWLGMMALQLLVGSAVAIDPVPDYKTLIMPTLVPKAGHGPNPPANFEAGLIRNAYETIYENYWTETSYFQFNRDTGEKVRGYYNDTKTYGYAQVPWALHAQGGSRPYLPNDFDGDEYSFNPDNDDLYEIGFFDGDRLYSENAPYVPDGADSDEVWTPGEAFEDTNGNGQWDVGSVETQIIEEVLGEDFWNSSNTNDNWGALWYLFGLEGPTNDEWSVRGEFFADYNNSVALGAGYVGYEANSGVWIADPGLGYNVFVPVNELDMNPSA
jgi:hypothetical protein